MKLTNDQYDFLKWVIVLVLPATTGLISVVGTELGWQYTETVTNIIPAVQTFLGSIFAISSYNYNKEGGINDSNHKGRYR